ncbi:MAG TPA: hypothetical protein VFT93_01770, partial [Candidatus Eisenbacteria bacterium]|nr:hypothetical protein [Candidatus Eisenbacteria bacterium]
MALAARPGRIGARLTTVALLLIAASAWAGGLPAHRAATHAKTAPTASIAHKTPSRTFDFERDIGLVEGERKDSLWLMIADSSLAVGDSLTL